MSGHVAAHAATVRSVRRVSVDNPRPSAVLTDWERAALRTGKSVAQVQADSRASVDAAMAELAEIDAREFNAAVAAGIVVLTDPRIADRSQPYRPARFGLGRDIRSVRSILAPTRRDTVPRSFVTGTSGRFLSALGLAAVSFFVLRGWLRNPTVAGRGGVTSPSPKGRRA